MNIKINTDAGEKEIDMKKPKGKHINSMWNFLMKMESGDPGAVLEYMNYVDELTAKLTGMSIDDLNELDIDEKKKLTSKITEKVMDSLDFMNASPKPESFMPKGGKQ